MGNKTSKRSKSETPSIPSSTASASDPSSATNMCSTIKTGTEAYMNLYPEGSTDGGKLRHLSSFCLFLPCCMKSR